MIPLSFPIEEIILLNEHVSDRKFRKFAAVSLRLCLENYDFIGDAPFETDPFPLQLEDSGRRKIAKKLG